MKLLSKICITALVMLFSFLFFAGCNVRTNNDNINQSGYTWEEYEALTPDQQMEFQNSFDSIESFDAWLQNAQSESIKKRLPWNNGGKQPSEYSWEEFEALDSEQQMAFQNSFGGIELFDEWLRNAQSEKEGKNFPWNNGDKQPSEYTWEEYESLSAEQQMAFQNSFGSIDEFNEWMQNAQVAEKKYPWDKEGAKQPSEYTLKEYESLTVEQQMEFQKSFGGIELFDEWLRNAQSEKEGKKFPWNNGDKQPSEYTWEEFESLTAEQQMAFQNSFDSADEFDAWLQNAQAAKKIYPWNKEGAKQPFEYTWSEFNALSGEEQIAFQNSFANIDEFDKWLTANQPQ